MDKNLLQGPATASAVPSSYAVSCMMVAMFREKSKIACSFELLRWVLREAGSANADAILSIPDIEEPGTKAVRANGCGRSLNGRDGAAVNHVLTARDRRSAR